MCADSLVLVRLTRQYHFIPYRYHKIKCNLYIYILQMKMLCLISIFFCVSLFMSICWHQMDNAPPPFVILLFTIPSPLFSIIGGWVICNSLFWKYKIDAPTMANKTNVTFGIRTVSWSHFFIIWFNLSEHEWIPLPQAASAIK